MPTTTIHVALPWRESVTVDVSAVTSDGHGIVGLCADGDLHGERKQRARLMLTPAAAREIGSAMHRAADVADGLGTQMALPLPTGRAA